MKTKRTRPASKKTYYLVLWWMSQTPYAAVFENQVAAEAAAEDELDFGLLDDHLDVAEVASDVVQKSVTYARDMGIKVLGMIENMSEYRCPSCGVESELFEGDTQALCDALNVPLLGRIPFDRTLAKSFDKGTPLLDATYPTIKRYQDIAERIIQIVDYKKVLAQKL